MSIFSLEPPGFRLSQLTATQRSIRAVHLPIWHLQIYRISPERDWALTAVGRADRPLIRPDQPGVVCKMPSTDHHGRSPSLSSCSTPPPDAAAPAPHPSYCCCMFGRAYHTSRLTAADISKPRRLPTLGRTPEEFDPLQPSRRVRRSLHNPAAARLLIVGDGRHGRPVGAVFPRIDSHSHYHERLKFD